MAVVSAAVFFDALDLSITQIALPGIQASLRIAADTLPWVAAAYVVTYGGFLLLGGRASDLLGARRIFLAGLSVFGLATLACGLAGTTTLLLTARAVQGVGASMTMPAAVSILATAFIEDRARTRAFGVFAAAASSGFTAGLVFGGLLTSGMSWRWIFLAKVPAITLLMAAAIRAVPKLESRNVGHGRGYDLAGAATATGGAVLLTYGVTAAGGRNPSAVGIAVPIVAAVVLLVAFALVERRTSAPLLPSRLIRSRPVAAADLAALTVLAAPFGVSFVVTVYTQDVMHRSPWATALVLTPGSILSALVARYLAPPSVNRFGVRPVYAGGLMTVAVGDAVLLALDASDWTWLVVVATLISLGFGMGAAYPAATLGGVHGVAPEDQGAGAGLNNAAIQIGGAIGLAVVATAVNAGLHGHAVSTVDAVTARAAIHRGALAATVLPIVGAAVAAFGLPRSSSD